MIGSVRQAARIHSNVIGSVRQAARIHSELMRPIDTQALLKMARMRSNMVESDRLKNAKSMGLCISYYHREWDWNLYMLTE